MTTPYTRSGTWRGLVLATAVSGTLLLLAGFAGAIWSGGSPLAMLTSTASSVIGDAAWRAPVIGPLLGLLVHFVLIGVIVDLYVIVAIRMPALVRHWRIAGVLFGILAWVLRTVIASPRDWPPAFLNLTLREAFVQMLLHILLLGLPTAMLTRLANRWRA
ncbi:hypothetical protein AWL63_21625 [Sphingomonas panacis]|uniref:Uncharacterized protein n=1 Tax=Sphingomonas panacis TaxID=1560345 RepID=A0A1B3ZFH0_9SPHN|nr:hypothetical protein [Sphingomonas panacis]AOH86168.1 hypothetical protein AWL63_21625 [Sphingomonas panacis]